MSGRKCVTSRVSNGMDWCYTHAQYLPTGASDCGGDPLREGIAALADEIEAGKFGRPAAAAVVVARLRQLLQEIDAPAEEAS